MRGASMTTTERDDATDFVTAVEYWKKTSHHRDAKRRTLWTVWSWCETRGWFIAAETNDQDEANQRATVLARRRFRAWLVNPEASRFFRINPPGEPPWASS